MKISYKAYNLILKYPFTISGYSRTSTPVVLIKIEYAHWVGYGEASLPQYLGETQESVIHFLEQVDLSQFPDPAQIESILDYVDAIAFGNTAAKASIDIALHDLVGRMLNKPWYSIWGLDKTKAPYTTHTIGMDTVDVVIKKTVEISSKFKILKVKLGGNDDKGIIDTIRSVTNLPIAVDANQAWSDKSKALDLIYWLKEKGVVMIEQPMCKTDLDGNAWLTERSPLPTFADESVQRLIDIPRLKGVFSGINIKLMKCTGMLEAYKMISLASQMEMKVMLGCMTETSCAISAAAQLSPMVDFADLDGSLLITNDCFDGVTFYDGKICLNDWSGIGVLPNMDLF